MSDWQKILIAVDETETAMRAIRYVGEVVAAVNVISVCLLHVFPDPPPDYYHKGGTLDEYKKGMHEQGDKVIAQATAILKEYGFTDQTIEADIRMAGEETISQAVLDAQKRWGCGTVVVGKRGVCKAEEFLFGSISNALARESRGFTTWVVG